MVSQLLIVGLGNPGAEYVGTRHNVGFEAVDALAASCHASTFQVTPPLHAGVATCEVADRRIILAKPTTYMNDSGRSTAALIQKYFKTHTLQGADAQYCIIIHDDLDLPVGGLRISVGGSSGGHRGVASVLEHWTFDFVRIRIGIGPNTTPDGHRIPSEKFVLEKFRKEERPLIDAAIARAVEAIVVLIRDGLSAAQQCTNR